MGMQYDVYKVTREKEVAVGLPGIDYKADESIELVMDKYNMKIYSFSNGLNRLVGAYGADWGGELKGYGGITNKLKIGDKLENLNDSDIKFMVASYPINGIAYSVFKIQKVNN